MRPLVSLIAALLAVSPAVALGAGHLDRSYAGDGIDGITLPFSSFTDDVYGGNIDTAGRTLIVGMTQVGGTFGAFVVRRTARGTADTSFDQDGTLRILPPVPYQRFKAKRIAEQTDGKLIVAGQVQEGVNVDQGTRPYVCRLLENGSMDATFGTNGCRLMTFRIESNIDSIIDMVIALDGRILLLGESQQTPGGVVHPAIARLDTDGTNDECFGDVACVSGGLVYDPFPQLSGENVTDILVTPQNRIVFGGKANFIGSDDPFVARLLPNGNTDLAYGVSGVRQFEGSANQSPQSVQAMSSLADGSVIVASDPLVTGVRLVELHKINATGTVVATFGTNGSTLLFYTDVTTINSVAGVVAQVDGTIVVGGIASSSANQNGLFGVAKFLANGLPDERFGFGGKNTAQADVFENPIDGAAAVVTTASRIWIIGDTYAVGVLDRRAVAVRFGNDDLFIDGFED